MSKRKRDLTEDEHTLWQDVTARVKPRRAPPKISIKPKSKPPTQTDLRVAAPKPATPAPSARTQKAMTPPADRGGEKRVRRGKIEIGATLDLHGHTQESGRATLIRFLQNAQRRGDRTVIVVTGVGRGGVGVLRQRLPEWLAEREVRGVISGFAQAHRSHGGAGAYYVFIKRRAE